MVIVLLENKTFQKLKLYLLKKFRNKILTLNSR